MTFAGAVGGIEGVAAQPGNTGAVGHGALFDQSNATHLSSSEGIGGGAGAGHCVLIHHIPHNNLYVASLYFTSEYLNSAHESVLVLAEFVSSRVVNLQSRGQTFLDVDRPFGIRRISTQSRDLYQYPVSFYFQQLSHAGNLFHIYLSVGVENFEWFLQEGKLGFLDELDRFKQEFGAVVHTQFSILDLLGFQIYFYISSNIFFLLFLNHTPFNKDGFRAYLDNGFASFLLYNNISSYSER